MRTPSPATVIAGCALLVALGGTGYAVLQVPRNSVGTAQLKAGAVTGAKVKAHTLRASNFAPGVLAAAGAAGAKGDTGAPGAKGDTGAQGPAGPSVSTWATNTVDVALSGTPATVIDTRPGHDITVTQASRLMVSGFATVSGGPGAWGTTGVDCYPVVTSADGTILDSNGQGDALAAPGVSNTNPAEMAVMINNSVDVDAGTYRVRAYCYKGGVGALWFVEGNLSVIATGR